MTDESPEVKDARIEWNLNALGEKLCAIHQELQDHVNRDEEQFDNLKNRLLGNPDHPNQRGLIGTVVDQSGDIAWLKKIGGWCAGIGGTIITGIVLYLIANQ